eukprot:2261614-Lingulodinium_polyedra.AAC.1
MSNDPLQPAALDLLPLAALPQERQSLSPPPDPLLGCRRLLPSLGAQTEVPQDLRGVGRALLKYTVL